MSIHIAAIIIVCIAALLALGILTPTATPHPKPQVLEDQIGKAEDVIPSVEEIQQAQARAGVETAGFHFGAMLE